MLVIAGGILVALASLFVLPLLAFGVWFLYRCYKVSA